MKKIQLLLLALLLASNNPLITKNPDNSTSASVKNIEKLENKKCNSKISKCKCIETTLATTIKATEEITKISLIMLMESVLSCTKTGFTMELIFRLWKLIDRPSPSSNTALTYIKFIILSIPVLSIFAQTSEQVSNVKNLSYNLINKEISTQEVLIKFSSFIGFLDGVRFS